LYDPKVVVTVMLGCVMNYFRQKEVFTVCGCPHWLGGNGFISPESAITNLKVEEVTVISKKGNVKCAVTSTQTWISNEIKSE